MFFIFLSLLVCTATPHPCFSSSAGRCSDKNQYVQSTNVCIVYGGIKDNDNLCSLTTPRRWQADGPNQRIVSDGLSELDQRDVVVQGIQLVLGMDDESLRGDDD